MGSLEDQRTGSSVNSLSGDPLAKEQKTFNKFARVGEDYQVEIPEFVDRSCDQQYSSDDDRVTLLFAPSSQADITNCQVDSYIKFVSKDAVKTRLSNANYGLRVPGQSRGVNRKVTSMIRPSTAPHLQARHPLLDYTYLDSGAWTDDERDWFYTSLRLHGKEFHKISKHVKTKTTRQCVQYFYVWKKQFPEKYARTRRGHTKLKKLHKQPIMDSPRMQSTADSPNMQPTVDGTHMQPMADSPLITRGSARRSVAAAIKRAVELAEAGEMGDTDVSPPLQECLSQPHHGSCPQQVSADTVLQANCESVPNAAVISKCFTFNEESPKVLPFKIYICSFEDCQRYFFSKQKFDSHASQHKKGSKFSPHTPSRRTVNSHTATPSPVSDHISTPSPVSDHSTEAVFPCSQCDSHIWLRVDVIFGREHPAVIKPVQ